MIGAASICAVIALASVLYRWHFVNTATRVDGRIIQMVERQSDHGTLFAPVFTFRDSRGAEHTVHSSTGTNPPAYQVGDTVRVLYAPEHPHGAKVDRFLFLWGLPLVTGLLAAFGFPLGLLVWYWPSMVQRFRPEPPDIHPG